MRWRALLTTVFIAATATAALVAVPAAAQPTAPVLVAVRTGSHPGFDRVVFEFRGGLPAERSIEYVDQLISDPAGRPVWIAGSAILAVRFFPAQAHTPAGDPTVPGRIGFETPNAMQVVRNGDFEAVLNHGIGLARAGTARIFTLTNPSRVVIDVDTTFETVPVSVYFVDQPNVRIGRQPYVSAVRRPVIPPAVAAGALQRLFAGPTATEQMAGLALVRSRATGFTALSISGAVARVRLTGGCDSGGSTITIADEIVPTLKQFPTVSWVKIYDPAGHTERPTGRSDSIPTCLEP
jgi:hypothetical protein